MNFITVINSVLSENTYIVFDEKTSEGFLIDPGSDAEKIEKKAAEKGVKIRAVLLTHGHFDHALSAEYFQKKGAKVYIHRADAYKLTEKTPMSRFFGVQYSPFSADFLFETENSLKIKDCIEAKDDCIGIKGNCIKVKDDCILEAESDCRLKVKDNCIEMESDCRLKIEDCTLKTEDDFLEICGMKVKVIHTPGHSKGGVCYYFEDEKILFSGDTLFLGDVGRTDLEGGDFFELKNSVTKKIFALPDETAVYPGHGEPTTIGREKSNKDLFNE